MTFRKLLSSRDFSIASTFMSCFFFFGSGFSFEAEVVMYRYVQKEWFFLFSEDVFYLISLRELSRKPSIPPLHEHQQSGWLLLPKGGIRRAVLATKKKKKHQHFQLLWLLSKIGLLFYFSRLLSGYHSFKKYLEGAYKNLWREIALVSRHTCREGERGRESLRVRRMDFYAKFK